MGNWRLSSDVFGKVRDFLKLDEEEKKIERRRQNYVIFAVIFYN
jgi:hypothetical protein